MDLRAGRRPARARAETLQIADQPWLPPVTELALELPVRMLRTFLLLLQPGSSLPGRDGIGVRPMSADWLQQAEVDAAKHGEPFY